VEWYLRPGEPVAPLRREVTRYFAPYADDDTLGAIAVVVGELLANVVRHTDSGARIVVDWANGKATLTVIDAGPGYTLENVRSPNSDDAHDALAETGLGLRLVQELASNLRVTRRARGGATVFVELPMT
jgi:anti-sigma regulatory factor (Ser/Thr protein kinase)